ncbi:MAG: PilZ domain-containing protein [Planctomycetota bacterium]|jgi:Tfp pilus assembly protein PilZ
MSNSENSDSHKKERRASTRTRRHGLLEFSHKGNDELVKAQIMNISDGGIRFISSIVLDLGEEIELLLEKKNKRKAVVLECKNLYNGYSIRTEYISE